MKVIDLNTTKEAILKWISSCETEQQLDLLLEVIVRFVIERFKNTGDVVEKLTSAIAEKKASIKLFS